MKFYFSIFFLFITFTLFSQPPEEADDFIQPYVTYSDEDPSLVVSKQFPNGLTIFYAYDDEKRCISKIARNGSQQILRTFIHYDNQGGVRLVVVDDGQDEREESLYGVHRRQILKIVWGSGHLAGKPLVVENFIYDLSISQAVLQDRTLYFYDEAGRLIKQEFYDKDENFVSSIGNELPENELVPSIDFIENAFKNQDDENDILIEPLPENASSLADVLWNYAVEAFFISARHAQYSAQNVGGAFANELGLSEDALETAENIGKAFLGDNSYLMMGMTNEKTAVGVYPGIDVNSKVRITFINGILTTQSGMVDNLELLSHSHGGSKIHYIFRPTEGWTWDLCRATIIRTAFQLGFRSWHAHLLAAQWRYLIHEMGGVNGGGVIIHYAHSLGGSETDRARELLKPEEQKMIRVTTFGSATLIRNVGFQSVINYVSISDGVPFLDPMGKIRNWLDQDSNLHYHGTPLYWIPLSDHLLSGVTYSRLVKECGEAFLDEFGNKS